MKLKERMFEWFVWLKHGHGAFLAFLLSVFNFIVIQYRLLVEYIPSLEWVFPTLTSFAFALMLVYIPVTIFLGWWDFKRGSVQSAEKARAQANPWMHDVSKALILVSEGKPEQVREILEKWLVNG